MQRYIFSLDSVGLCLYYFLSFWGWRNEIYEKKWQGSGTMEINSVFQAIPSLP